MNVWRRCITVLVLFVMVVAHVPAQQPSLDRYDDGPRPWSRDEFPEWAWSLRRGEIIAIGAFPIAMLLSSIVYQIGRFAVVSIQEGQVTAEQAPFFLSPGTGPAFNEEERIGLVVSGVVLSIGVAVADHILGRRERNVPESW